MFLINKTRALVPLDDNKLVVIWTRREKKVHYFLEKFHLLT